VFVDVPTALAPFLLPVMHLPGICVLVSDGSLVAARDVARWRAIIGESSAERQFMHILNKDGAPGALAPAEFLRAAGHAPDLTIPYDRNIAVASGLGIEAVHACPTLQRGLGPLFSLMSGQVPALHHSLLERMRARLLPHP
jgi:pilus assembly protein CpaE